MIYYLLYDIILFVDNILLKIYKMEKLNLSALKKNFENNKNGISNNVDNTKFNDEKEKVSKNIENIQNKEPEIITSVESPIKEPNIEESKKSIPDVPKISIKKSIEEKKHREFNEVKMKIDLLGKLEEEEKLVKLKAKKIEEERKEEERLEEESNPKTWKQYDSNNLFTNYEPEIIKDKDEVIDKINKVDDIKYSDHEKRKRNYQIASVLTLAMFFLWAWLTFKFDTWINQIELYKTNILNAINKNSTWSNNSWTIIKINTWATNSWIIIKSNTWNINSWTVAKSNTWNTSSWNISKNTESTNIWWYNFSFDKIKNEKWVEVFIYNNKTYSKEDLEKKLKKEITILKKRKVKDFIKSNYIN